MTLHQFEILARTWLAFLLVNIILFEGLLTALGSAEVVRMVLVNSAETVAFCLLVELLPILGGAIIFARSRTQHKV